jgi:hypothetical protein
LIDRGVDAILGASAADGVPAADQAPTWRSKCLFGQLPRLSSPISNSHFFAGNVHYIAGSLNTWGWVVLCIGVAEWIVGTGVFVKSQFSRWVGVVVLGVNSIVQLMMIPAYPFWSLSVFTLDILAIFGLLAYGARISNAD